MKLSELRPCAVCRGPLVPIWQVVRISMAALDRSKTQRVLGMTQFFGGNLALAEVMTSDDCVMVLGDQDPAMMTEFNICQTCFLKGPINLAELVESQNADESKA